MNRTWRGKFLDNIIGNFIEEYRKHSHLDPVYAGAYYWNEREIQWALMSHLRDRMFSYSFGSPWWVHAEGSIVRPWFARRKEWPAPRRADVVLIDHSASRRWYKNFHEGRDTYYPRYEAMIELKLFWSGQGPAYIKPFLEADTRKLRGCLKDGAAKEAYQIVLDGLDRKRVPYLRGRYLERLKRGTKLQIFHWPDSEKPILDSKKAPYGVY